MRIEIDGSRKAAGAVASVQITDEIRNFVMVDPQLGHFSKTVGDKFRLAHPDGLRTMLLKEAKALGGSNGEADPNSVGRPGGSFSLVFEETANAGFQQGSYKVKHSTIGEFDIFLVPIGKTDNGFIYEAIFN